MDKIVNIQNLDPTTLELQTYSTDDQSLISSFDLENSFTSSVDYVEYSVYDINQNLLLYIDDFTDYSILNNKLQLDPEKNLEVFGFDEGQYVTNYSFLKNILGSTNNNRYYISEISSDRTELRLDTTLIDNNVVIDQTNDYKIQLEQSPYYKDFYLNFGNNDLIIANNILLDTLDPTNPTVLIKLYEPLPQQFNLKSELWVVETISTPLTYQIDITLIFDNLDGNIQLQGPNINIPIKDRINNSTEYTNFNTLKSTSVATGTSSLKYQLNSILNEKGFEINIDYNDYSNFVFFSSAQTRLENFYYKVSLIEEYSNQSNQNITGSSTGSYYVSSNFDIYQNKIDDIITKFDGYEYFLYFESGSKCWPKINNEVPYINASTTSSAVINWLNEQYTEAYNYDENLNINNLVNTIPSYISEDPINEQYTLFVEMIGQHFDSIWVYIKDISNKYNADNRLDYGVSKDLISDVLRDLGIKIYQNNFSVDDLYSSFLGITPSGSLLAPTGSEIITNYVSASIGPYVLPGYVIVGYSEDKPIIIPLADINNSIYKRIYHNVPYLFKKKGTVEGLRALITLYGIPDTILRINEFGGKNKDNSNDWDQWQNQYNYSLYSSIVDNYPIVENGNIYGGGTYGAATYTSTSPNSGVVIIPWDNLSTTNATPSSVAFRFKTDGIPTLYKSQSLLFNELSLGGNAFNLVLEYSESLYGSYSGSGAITSSTYDWGTLKLILPNVSVSCSIYLPLFNEDWWSVLVTKTNSTHSLYVKNKIYNGNDGNQLGFQASSSVITSNASWNNIGNLYLGGFRSGVSNSIILGKTYTPYIGTLQEFRYYSIPLSESVFDDFVMNPYSIEGNTLNGSQSSLEILKLRAPLGSVLDTDISQNVRLSSHPSLTKYPSTSSFWNGTSNYTITGSFIFNSNTETIFLDQFPAGIRNAINNKIKIAQSIIPTGDTLSPYIRIQQDSSVSGSYTKDLNLLEVAFSPQNEINQDIISQLGYFNLGDYIGDPRQLAQSKDFYPDLNTLRDEYFSKYTSNYNLTDYIRLIKYFDNSLFKMIKDFVPARTSLSSGIVIKPHLLERSRYRVPSSSYSEPYYTASVKSFPFDFESSQLYRTSGGGAGEFNSIYINELTQSWSESIVTPLGIVNKIHSDKSEFLTGELSGSTIIATTQSLGPTPLTFELELIKISPAANLPEYYDVDFKFKSDKVYYLELNINNTDTSNLGSIYAFWLGTNASPADIVYENNSIPTSTLISPFIKIENAKTRTLRVVNASILNISTSVSALIYEAPNDLPNPLLNNVPLSRTSIYREDVDYSSGQLVPVNQQLLISGTATPAQVQDYNWNVRRSTLPRYEGSKLTGAKINVYTVGDKSYGKEPVINNYQTSFLTFKEIRNAYPELVNKSTLWINSLVDKDGNQLAVDFSTGSNYYYNLIDNFGKDSSVNLQITTVPSGSTENSDDLDQSTTVYRPALFWPKVILTNESRSIFNYNTNTPSFTRREMLVQSSPIDNNDLKYYNYVRNTSIPLSFGSSNPAYRLSFITDIGPNFFGDPDPVQYPSVWELSADQTYGDAIVVPISASVSNTSDASISLYVDTPVDYDVNIRISLVVKPQFPASDYRVYLGSWNFFTRNISNQPLFQQWSNVKLLPGYKVTILVEYSTNPSSRIVSGRSFTIKAPGPQFYQLFIESFGESQETATLPANIFSVGSDSRNILTGSSDFQNIYGLLYKQSNTTGNYGGVGGYDPITEYFNPQVGDEIRFNQNESLAFIIIGITESLLNSKVYIQLNNSIPSNITVDTAGFLIRRNTIDPSKLVINAPKLVGGAPGYLTPQYMSPDLIASLDKSVETLKENGIL